MPIYISRDETRFHLTDGETFSRVLAVVTERDGNCGLQEWYLGAALPQSAADTLEYGVWNEISFDTPHQMAPYALPTAGRGDFRPCQIAVREQDGSCCPVLHVTSCKVYPGKPELPGLPSTYAEAEDEAATLDICLKDDKTGLTVTLRQSVMEKAHALTSALIAENGGDAPLTIEKMASVTLNLHGGWDILHLYGAWAKERQMERVSPTHGLFTLNSERGASGHEHNPFMALMEKGATEFSGRCLGVSLVYSGSFRMEADMNAQDNTRVVAGIAPCAWRLAPGDTFVTPEAVMAWSEDGLNRLSQRYHELYRTRLCRGPWRDKVRPVLVNNWEATYFDFDEEKLLTIARTAAELGVELFVLDDGWFGCRNSDNCSLGDWTCNRKKLPEGLSGLGAKLKAMGLMFGLWVEPEMISPDSDLYRAHPDWCLHVPGRFRTQARQQLVLDMTRQDVQDYLIATLTDLIRDSGANYIKWDMNRNFAETGSALLPADRQGEVPHRYMLGLYRVLREVTGAFPDVLFESCSGGGGRFDPGMLAFMPQTWTSDDTDGVERLFIQYGTSVAYPASTMGAHVSAVPNHQVGRMTTMKFRGDVALGGNMGYELDLSRQTPEDLAEIRRQIVQVKRFRRLIQQGRFTRLLSPFENRLAAWQFADEGQGEVLLCVFQRYAAANPADCFIPVRDIDENALYRDDAGKVYSGGVLKYQGYRAPFGQEGFREDHDSVVLHLTRVDGRA